MNFRFSRRRAAFLASFLIVPAVVWAADVSPALKQRQAFIEGQAKAGAVQARNRQLPDQRDELRASWEQFSPKVSAAFEQLADDLNPHLVQKRIFEIAQELNCEVKISRLAARDDENFQRFTLSGSGNYGQLVRFVDELEQGQHYVRFEKLTLELPGLNAMSGERAVRVTGVLLIPAIASVLQEAAAQ